MDKLAEVFKVFIERHLIPSLISIAGAIITLLLVPENHWVIVKIGIIWFVILAFCIYFISIQFLVFIVSRMRKISNSINEKRYMERVNVKSNNEAKQAINEFVDRLSVEDKEIILSFVRNGNKILIAFDRIGNSNGLLWNSEILNISEYTGNIKKIDKDNYWLLPSLEQTLAEGMCPIGVMKQYRLKESYFHNFNLVYKLTGKLGNF